MLKKFKNFSKSEQGAVTVDWVVLTAAVVALAAGVAALLLTDTDGAGIFKALKTKIIDAIGVAGG